MKALFRHALIAAFVLLARAAGEGESVVRFSNGDQLSGSIGSLTPDKLVFKSPILENPEQVFFLKKVLDLTLPVTTPDLEAGHEATLTLTSGDLIRGQLAAVGDETVEIDTWFAGRMKFRRVMVKELRIKERSKVIYRGPSGIDGWIRNGEKPLWNYQNASFRSSAAGGIARDVGMPDECRIAFDVAWRGPLKLNMIFFSGDVSSAKPETGYDIMFDRYAVRLRKCGTHNTIGQTQGAYELKENEKARIEIRASLKSRRVCFFVDGRIVDVWTLPETTGEDLGRGLHFVSQDTSPLRISGIEISSWDGVIDDLPPTQQEGNRFRGGGLQGDQIEQAPPQPEEPRDGRMLLRNGDTLEGEVMAIDKDMVQLKTPFTEVKIPISRLRNITLKPVGLEEPKRMNGDVRASFPDGSTLVFRLDQVDAETFTGFSQNFGTARFKIAAFNRVEFNIYDPDLDEIRAGDGW